MTSLQRPSKRTRAERIIDFVHTYCRVPEGKLVGRPMRLDDFQKDFIRRVYDNPNGTRRAILSIARKNGKSGLIAALVLAHIAGPEARKNSQIVSGAQSRDQAALVFNLASKMVNLNPTLAKLVRIVPSGKRLIGLAKNVEYRALAAEGKTAHGLSPAVVVFDELGQVKGAKDAFVEALETAQGAYDDGLQLVISTQAPTDADMLSIWIDDAQRSDDPHTVCAVYAADEDADLGDPKQWEKANPAIGSFRSRPELEQAAEKAKRMPAFESSFRNLYLNQRVNMVAAFVSPLVWKQGNGAPESLDGTVYGGLDLSATTDLTAFVLTCRMNGLVHVAPFFWMPLEMVADATRRDRAPYDVWVREGLIRTTPGKVIDYDFVARDIGQITSGLSIAKIGFDRWRMDRMKGALERQGVELPLEPFGQGYVSMSPALDALEADLLNGIVRHGGHPVLAMCAANAVAIPDPAGNRKLDKSKATGRIDGMVALAMAEGVEAMSQEVLAPTPWDNDPSFSLADI
ncbi:terminase large subunit [Novosphingobium sp. KN65.2]|uniref:terminase large subunit n=1 Tax=Novosphingobium sp. KN65.2 TaxID=1478134 RepID=UPI0006D5A6D7|nr:terminase TerL endonuclease subunit [Novosphingobium sp. KN65.2]